jgi:hypothetical protein
MDWAEPSENGVRRRALVSSLKAVIYLDSRTAVQFDSLRSPLIASVTDKSGYSAYGFGWSRLIPILDWSFLSPINFRNRNSPPTPIFHSISILNRYFLLETGLHQFLPRVWYCFRPYSCFVQKRLKRFPLAPSSLPVDFHISSLSTLVFALIHATSVTPPQARMLCAACSDVFAVCSSN